VRVRETVPDTFLDRADEVINVDVTVEELRNRLREGKIYRPEKVEQALSNFFRKGNLSTLRELALRAVADEVGEKAASYRAREGLEPALIPERVMVCMSSNALAPRVIRTGARIAGRLGSKWYAVYVETPREKPDRINPRDSDALQQNTRLAESLGATVVRVRADRPADGLIAFAQREGVTHVIFGQSARSRWELIWRGSTLDRFLGAVPDAAVQVVPLNDSFMLDLANDIRSLSDFKRNTVDLLDRLRKTGHPLVLTINGKAELVVQDAGAYQALLDRVEAIEGIQRGLADVKAGRTKPARQVFARLRRKHGIRR
jgi:K+-sensing histidine kinase KdpD